MFIGEVSKATGASAKAIRLYEGMGLLRNVVRSGRYRVYTQEHIVLIDLIRQAKTVGFTLSEIKRFTDSNTELEPWRRVLSMIESKQESIRLEIQTLEKRHAALTQYTQEIQTCLSDNPHCGLIERPD